MDRSEGAMYEGDYAPFFGKLVRLKLNRGLIKDRGGVLLSEDSQSIRLSELYSMGHFRVETIAKVDIDRLLTLDLVTGDWPRD